MSAPATHTAPSVAWDTTHLLASLARAGWGDLSGSSLKGSRAVLQALVNLLPWGSGAGFLTASQVADAADYSTRWTRQSLDTLESLGVIEWRRGWLKNGQPMPGHIKIIKKSLVDLINKARVNDAQAKARIAARVKALAERLKALRCVTVVYQRTPLIYASIAKRAGRLETLNKPKENKEASRPGLFDRMEATATPFNSLQNEEPAPLSDAGVYLNDRRSLRDPSFTAASLASDERALAMQESIYSGLKPCEHGKRAEYCRRCREERRAPRGFVFRNDICQYCLQPATKHRSSGATDQGSNNATKAGHEFLPRLSINTRRK